MSSQRALGGTYPTIDQTSILIEPWSNEERHGITITFQWTSLLSDTDLVRFQSVVAEEFAEADRRTLEREPGGRRNYIGILWVPQPILDAEDGTSAGLFCDEQRVVWGDSRWSRFPEEGVIRHVITSIRTSEEWRMFYTDPGRHTIMADLDGAGEQRGEIAIPEFRTDVLLYSVEVQSQGGTIVFMDAFC